MKIILVGNKCDMENARIISKLRAKEFANQYRIDYIETSALKNINVKESIDLLLGSVIDYLEENHSLSKQSRVDAVKLFNEQLNRKHLERDGKPKAKNATCCS